MMDDNDGDDYVNEAVIEFLTMVVMMMMMRQSQWQYCKKMTMMMLAWLALTVTVGLLMMAV
jgi:hypothetical protein